MKPLYKNLLIYGLPLVAAAGVIYMVNKKRKSRITPAKDEDVKDIPAPPAPAPSPLFPLQKGSRNEKVKELQRIIGTTADGIFGDQTENKLIEFAGVRFIKNQAELDSLKNKSIGISNKVRADDLVAKFKQGGYSMYVIKDGAAELVTIDAYGAVQSSGKFKGFVGGKSYDPSQFKLAGSTKMGYLILDVSRPDMAGTYIIDPSIVSLK